MALNCLLQLKILILNHVDVSLEFQSAAEHIDNLDIKALLNR